MYVRARARSEMREAVLQLGLVSPDVRLSN